MTPPKAILFDIGGVVVLSPFRAILDYERDNNIPIGYINHSIQHTPSTTGAWQRLERGECELNEEWFTAFTSQLSNPHLWAQYWKRTSIQRAKKDSSVPAAAVEDIPPVPHIDGKTLFWAMMRISRTPDPHMYPAVQRLRQSGKFILGALSNTVVFPPGIRDEKGEIFSKTLVHPPAAQDSGQIEELFDVFISSAHVGLRKPDRRVYEMAVGEMDRVSKERGGEGVGMGDVVFLDDIGANLRGAREVGMGTIKVNMGRVGEAVRELEGVTGVRLLDEGGNRAKL